ncbi:MAG: Rod shape-determining protein MreB, partial [uncultured Gemmatimonadaceae bacterium]
LPGVDHPRPLLQGASARDRLRAVGDHRGGAPRRARLRDRGGREGGVHGRRADGRGDRRGAPGRDAHRQHGDRHRRRHHRDRRHRALGHRERHLDPHRRRRARHVDRAVHAQELQPPHRGAHGRADQDRHRLRGAALGGARHGGEGARPRLGHPEDGARALGRDPRGDPGADPADRRRRAARARDHAPRAVERHRRPGHRDDRRRCADPRARHPAEPGDEPADPRRRGPAHVRGARHGTHPRRRRQVLVGSEQL